MIYLDNNSTTPVDPQVLEAMLPYYGQHYGNAASTQHAFGWVADEAVKVAKSAISSLAHCSPEELFFTSGATEAVNLALKGAYESYGRQKKHIITLATEHPAVLDTCKYLTQQGADITVVPVNPDGLLDLGTLKEAIREDTLLVCVMFANNETGVIQPIKEVADITHEHEVFLFCDATQALGKVEIDVNEFGIDLMAGSAHKMYGPKGSGVLYARRKNPRVRPSPQMHGGGHESGMRSGTLNVPAIVGFGKAAEICTQDMVTEADRIRELRDLLEQGLLDEIPGSKINGNIQHRMAHVSNMVFPGISAASLMSRLTNICVSAGSACSSAHPEPSHVLRAMGLNDADAKASLRFSLGRYNTREEIEYTIQEVITHVKELTEQATPK